MKMSSVGKNSTYGSKDRKRVRATLEAYLLLADSIYSTIQRRLVEGPCRVARPVSLQKPKHRLCQPHIPSKHRRDVRLFLRPKMNESLILLALDLSVSMS